MARFNRSGLGLHWQKTLPAAGKLGPPAISAAGDVFALGENGTIYGYRSDGSPVWATFPSVPAIPYAPNCCSAGPLRYVVLTGGGLLLANASDSRVHAISLATGVEVWSSPTLGGVPQHMLVADNGIIYAQVPSAGIIYGLNETTGEVRYQFQNVPTAMYQGNSYPEFSSMVLRQGTLYVVGGLNLLGFRVPSTRLAPTSPWPRVFHDNQNTCHLESSLSN